MSTSIPPRQLFTECHIFLKKKAFKCAGDVKETYFKSMVADGLVPFFMMKRLCV